MRYSYFTRMFTIVLAALMLASGGLSFAGESFCGKPIISRMFIGKKVGAGNFGGYFDALSKKNMAGYAKKTGALSPDEEQLVKKIEENPPYKVHRIPYQYIKTAFKLGKLMSHRQADALSTEKKRKRTSVTEEILYDAYDCVFAAVGSPLGRETYGDVVVYLRDNVSIGGWATPWSGVYFMKHHPLTLWKFDRAVYGENSWARALALSAVRALRAMPAEKRAQVLPRLLAADRPTLWKMFDTERLGYLEGKYDASIPLDQVQAVYIPDQHYAEAVSCPEAAKWKNIIQPASAMPH